jgi:hypothetical protein
LQRQALLPWYLEIRLVRHGHRLTVTEFGKLQTASSGEVDCHLQLLMQPVDGADQHSQRAGAVMSDDNGIDEIDDVPMALFIDEMMEDLPVTDEEVATRIGYSAAVVRMFRQGTVKVPFDVIPDLADAIGAEPRGLMERALREYVPELVDTLIDLYANFTDDQWKIVKLIRELNGLEDHPYVDTRLRASLEAALAAMREPQE